MSLLCLLLDSILAPCSLPLAARACRSTAFQPPCIFILDKPLAGCTSFFFCTLRPFWAFCRIATLRYFGNKRRNTAVWGCLVLGCHLAVRSGTQGFTGAMAGYLGGRSGASSGPSRLLIHTFPLSLRRLPLAAIQQVVAVAGLAVATILQHLYVAFDVDEPLGLQFMKRSPRCGFRTSAGIGYSPDPRLTGIPASGTAGAWQREMFRRGVSAKEAVLPFRKEELPLFCVFEGLCQILPRKSLLKELDFQ